MPTPSNRDLQDGTDGLLREDEPVPRASDEDVLEDTVRLAREGQRELENDPKERGSTAGKPQP